MKEKYNVINKFLESSITSEKVEKLDNLEKMILEKDVLIKQFDQKIIEIENRLNNGHQEEVEVLYEREMTFLNPYLLENIECEECDFQTWK